MSLRYAILRAPLVPVAILATIGVIIDRTTTAGWPIWVAVFIVGVGVWLIAQGREILALLGLAVGMTGLAALHHNLHRNNFLPDDIGFAVSDEPKLARLRGTLTDEPTFDAPAVGDPLRSIPEAARTHAVIEVEALIDDAGDRPVSGLVALTMIGPKPTMRAGDGLEVQGWIQKPRSADNPGERDYASSLLDQRIRATIIVRRVGDSVVKPQAATDWSWDAILAATRAWSRRQLDESLPPAEAGVAAALLLGDGTALARADWEKYIRTGVIHVLAVSGQHLAVLAAFAWVVLRGVGVRRRWGALIVGLGLCYYSALAGGRPPVLRSAVMVAVASGGVVLRRPTSAANGFAFAWLAVVFLNPTDIADAGCQFSFLCVAVLIWGIGQWIKERPVDPVRELIDAARPTWQRWLIEAWRAIALSYVVTFVLGLAVMPLVAARYHLVSPVGLLIGPPAVFLASVALIAGFLHLTAALVCPPLVVVIAFGTRWSLAGLTALVDFADKLPYGHWYVGDVALWWLVGFYVLVAGMIWFWSHQRVLGFATLAAWFALGIAVSFVHPKLDGLRVTFMAVGHGGATLIQTPDGRSILVDVGSMTGPDVTRRVVAPYLWHLGVDQLDEVFLTHADLDHFNGLPALMDRFPVGRVNLTPSYSAKPTPGVREIIQRLQLDRIPTRIVQAGDQFSAGDVEFEVLHPPAVGPAGPENARSLVLVIRHAGHGIALTGDLDLEGRTRVMAQPAPGIDVWMAPHHGGRTASPPELARWVRPRLVVAHNANNEAKVSAAVYESAGADFLGTWPHGAITIVSKIDGLWATTFKTKRRLTLDRGMLAN
jgi:competence protein ComEC